MKSELPLSEEVPWQALYLFTMQWNGGTVNDYVHEIAKMQIGSKKTEGNKFKIDKKEMFLKQCITKGSNCFRSLKSRVLKRGKESNHGSISNLDTNNSILSQKTLSDY